MKNQPGHLISSSSVRLSSLNVLLFKRQYHIKMKRCLLKEIMLTDEKSDAHGNPKCDQIPGVPDLRISVFLAEANRG